MLGNVIYVSDMAYESLSSNLKAHTVVSLTNRHKTGKEVITIESHLHVYLSGKLENSIGN